MKDWQERYKDADPIDTVEKIKSILKNAGFKTKYNETSSGKNGCYASRLHIVDDNGREITGTNGKGMSKEFAMASAYGEMMERLQNCRTNVAINPCDKKINNLTLDSEYSYDLFAETQLPCIKKIIEDIANTIELFTFDDMKKEMVKELLFDVTGKSKDNKCKAMPMYSVKEKKDVIMPYWICNFTRTNGFAAGNTLEEAIVEGISEIFERYSYLKILDGDIIPPQIPNSEIYKYPNVKRVIDSINATDKYNIIILDGSLGIGLPVVCGIIINKDTGYFAAKFGSHPNMGIALERIFTEILQGTEIEDAVNKNYINFNAETINNKNINWNYLKAGFGAVPKELFMDTPTYEYKKWNDTNGKSNKDLLREMLKLVDTLHKEIFIRDVSFLGFPAVKIYIPEMTEVIKKDFITLKQWKLELDVIKIFERLENVNNDDINKIKLLAKFKFNFIGENTINCFSGNTYDMKMLGAPFEISFLYIVCCICLKEYENAINSIMKVKQQYDEMEDEKTKNLYEAIYTYVSAINSKLDYTKVCKILKTLFPNIADYVIDLFSDTSKTLMKLYPNCKKHDCDNCSIKECMSKEIYEFNMKLDKLAKNNMPDSKELAKLIAEVS